MAQNPGIQIKQAKLSDLEAIVKVENSAFPPHRQASTESLKGRLELFPEGCLVALKNGEIIGFSTALIINDIRSLPELDVSDEELHSLNREIYWLRSIVIDPNHQKEGVGKLIMQKQLEKARNLNKKAFRFTAAQDVEGFYKKLGFTMLTDYEDFHSSDQAIWELNLA